MGRGTLWAASVGPSPSDETIDRIASDLGVAPSTEPHSPFGLFRSMRTMLNVTQKEWGLLVSPEGSVPISASVVCQLETGSQVIPSIILERAAMATSAVLAFADWRLVEQSGCFDSQLSALRALGSEAEGLLQPYTAHAILADGHADLVATYLGVVSKRKPSTAGNRPATRGPYKKKPSAKRFDSSSMGSSSAASSVLSDASTSRAASPVPSSGGESVGKARARAPATKAKRRPVAVGLEGASPSSSESSGEGATELQTLKECLLDGQAVITPRTADALDFLTRLEHAEARDDEALATAAIEQEALQRLRRQCGVSCNGRSPRDSPRGDCKRRAVKPVARSLGAGGECGAEISIVDLDQLDLKDFTLDELLETAPQSEPPLESVDEIMELVCKQMESPRWSDFGAEAELLAECMC